MGVQLTVRYVDFFLAADRKADALAAVKGLLDHPELMGAADYVRGQRIPHFSWVDDRELREAESLREALLAWGWRTRTDEAGNVVSLRFEGEKLGDEDVLFGALAPFTREGSEIQAVADGEEMFRWHFTGGRVHQDASVPAWKPCPETGEEHKR